MPSPTVADARGHPVQPPEAIPGRGTEAALRGYVNWLFTARLADGRSSLPASSRSRSEAAAAARAWLEILDRGDYAGCLERAALIVRRALTTEQWDRAVRAVRAPLGACLSRRLRSLLFVASPPCGPGGPYALIQFESDFAERPSVSETIAASLGNDGRLRVAGYLVA